MELPLRRACYGNSVTHTLEPLRFDPEYEIYFRHPAFLDPHDILIIIPGLDHPDGGIHHQTALDACAVLANNRYDGWFTEDREGTVRVKIPLDGILQKKNYYFQVSDNYQDVYPIVPSFEDWAFPHGNLPRAWNLDIPRTAEHPTPRQSTLMDAILSRDIRCRVTNHIEGTECAHLIPRNQSSWFQRNMMARYGKTSRPGSEPIDNPRNAILLRSDIHTSFDYRRFTFVPKPRCTASTDLRDGGNEARAYAIHIFCSPDPHELTSLYHNVTLQLLTGVAPEYLFARFAWTIFQFIPIFVQAGVPRRIALYEPATSLTSSVPRTEPLIKTLSGEECRLLPLRNKSRSSSPKKRKPEDEETGSTDMNCERGRQRKVGRYGDIPTKTSMRSSFESDAATDGPWFPESPSGSTEDTDLSELDPYDKDNSTSHRSSLYHEISRQAFNQ
ncbi:hypothetical protein DTO166G4_7368 [Paecilomyces variotii]|nr:hypothetical protein DTO164E3_4795 [Paecilomyces variotii]KAJ9211077.1 hypothetical protein DTO166G4_7368 [Paecilomyces variotii]KAJ9230292.1 hypothetical protein DTO166G5_7374 [Paecilomyces variotii]KAJ9307894.1 hypothetical protein DTO217A2_2650 [Paecilomyces variotii]